MMGTGPSRKQARKRMQSLPNPKRKLEIGVLECQNFGQ